jgi:hypothetical protein
MRAIRGSAAITAISIRSRSQDVASDILHGWLPQAPLIGPETRIAAFGSCFAQHISDWLGQRNFSVLTRKDGDYRAAYVVRFGEGMVNTLALRQQFEWAFEARRLEGELWLGYAQPFRSRRAASSAL